MIHGIISVQSKLPHFQLFPGASLHNGTVSGGHPQCRLQPASLVPQPTCFWKWVGVSMPLRADNFSLRPSSTAILQDSMLSGCLLSPYGSQVALTPTTKFHIHPVLLQSSIYITLPILTSHPPNPHFVSDMFLDSISHFYLQSYF